MTRLKGRWLKLHRSRIAMDVVSDMGHDKAAQVVRILRHGASGD